MTTRPTILASTWNNGLFIWDNGVLSHERPNHSVRGLSHDGQGGAYACVDGHFLNQRTASGEWKRLASCQSALSVTVAVNDAVYVGTDDAQVLRLNEKGELDRIDSFDNIEGRERWFAGTAIINGQEVGPPLGVRSMSGSKNGPLFANVHVGGIPRSVDAGATWQPTIDVDLDAHDICVSPYDNRIIAAATAAGLCVSWDAGQSWTVQTDGLHAPYCSAVAVTADHIFLAASESHFSQDGAIYRRSTERSKTELKKISNGLPAQLGGIADSMCIASNEADMAIISSRGDLFRSDDCGLNWRKEPVTIEDVSSVLII